MPPDAGPRSNGSFSQRVAVIVGGGSGLGRAVAKGPARRGPDKAPDTSLQLEQLAATLIKGLHQRHFLILGDPGEASMFEGSWGQLDARPARQ